MGKQAYHHSVMLSWESVQKVLYAVSGGNHSNDLLRNPFYSELLLWLLTDSLCVLLKMYVKVGLFMNFFYCPWVNDCVKFRICGKGRSRTDKMGAMLQIRELWDSIATSEQSNTSTIKFH